MWNPWTQLKAEPDVLLIMRDDLPPELGGGAYWPDAGGGVIVLDRRLSQVERNCVLAHELVHHERGGGCGDGFMPESWRPVAAREEQVVDDIAVERLVPYEQLLRFVVGLESTCVHPEVWHVADEFHVTERAARRALELMNQRLSDALRKATE